MPIEATTRRSRGIRHAIRSGGAEPSRTPGLRRFYLASRWLNCTAMSLLAGNYFFFFLVDQGRSPQKLTAEFEAGPPRENNNYLIPEGGGLSFAFHNFPVEEEGP